MEKKQSLRTRIVNWWKNLDPEVKTACIGGVVGSAIAGVGISLYYNRREDAIIQANVDICDTESKLAYQRGLQDGQVKAYYTLLTDPTNAMKKMGFTDVKQF